MKLPFLDAPLLPIVDNCVDLHKHIFHPDLPNLGFIGLVTVAGPIPPVVELQARVAAQVFTGAIRLPSSAQMHQEIQKRRSHLVRLGAYPMRVQLLDYMDELARMIGCRPKLLHHLNLFPMLLAGPLTPSQYRLDGPGRSPDAETTIRRG